VEAFRRFIVREKFRDEFRISAANEKIKDKMTLAKMLPFTNGPEEQRALTRALLG
jgi:hypothetical protein